MNELYPGVSRKLFWNSDKLFYDNIRNLDERLNVNDNFNENKYEQLYREKYARNKRRFKTEPPKNICEEGNSKFYPSFFNSIFKSLSRNVVSSEEDKQGEEDAKDKKKTSSRHSNHSGDVTLPDLDKGDSPRVSPQSTNNVAHVKSDVDESFLVKNTGEGKPGEPAGGGRRRYTYGSKRGVASSEEEEEEELQTEGESGEVKRAEASSSPYRSGEWRSGEYRTGGVPREGVKRMEQNRGAQKTASSARLVNSDVISDVFLKKNVKSLVVHDTGGIDIELIENENPEFLYHTYTGNRISNMYYAYDDSIKSKEYCDDKKINRFNSTFSRRENGTMRESTSREGCFVRELITTGEVSPRASSVKESSAYNGRRENKQNTSHNKSELSTDSNNSKRCDEQSYTKKSEMEEKVSSWSNEVYHYDSCNTYEGNRNKGTSNWSGERNKVFASYSSVSSISVNTLEKDKGKKYHYIGETMNNVRNGWGMLIYNDRVIFEGEYKMNNAIGYFIKYNEYSTEIGFRSPLSIKSVVIMSDSDNFIIQNKCENLESVKSDEMGASQNGTPKLEGNDSLEVAIKGKEGGLLNCEGNVGAFCETRSYMEKSEINLSCPQKFPTISNYMRLSDYRRTPGVFTTPNSNKLYKENVLMNNLLNSIKDTECSTKKKEEVGGKAKNLTVVSSYIRRNSKHRTTPARSINYLKPPMMHLIKNNIILNKNSFLKNDKSASSRKRKEQKTTMHCSTPMSIIVTSFDTDDESGSSENDAHGGNDTPGKNEEKETCSAENGTTLSGAQPVTVLSERDAALEHGKQFGRGDLKKNGLTLLNLENNNHVKGIHLGNEDDETNHFSNNDEKAEGGYAVHSGVVSTDYQEENVEGFFKGKKRRTKNRASFTNAEGSVAGSAAIEGSVGVYTEDTNKGTVGKTYKHVDRADVAMRGEEEAERRAHFGMEASDEAETEEHAEGEGNGQNKLNIVITDQYRNLLCDNINNDNFVIKNNEIKTFEEFMESQGEYKAGGRDEWREAMRDPSAGADYQGGGDGSSLKTTIRGDLSAKCKTEQNEQDEKKEKLHFGHPDKAYIRRRLRGATFPETHDDRQKNCFLFIDDYLTSNDDKFNLINEDVKLRASDYNKWSVNMLYNFLKMIGLKKEAYLFKIHKIRGYHILKLTDKELKRLNINNSYVRKFVLSVFRFLVNSMDSADPLSLNFNTNRKFSFNKIRTICNSDIIILNKVGGGSYAQVFRAKYKGKYVACKLFLYNPKDMSEESYCESYISTPRSSHQYIFPKIAPNLTVFDENHFGDKGILPSYSGQSDTAEGANQCGGSNMAGMQSAQRARCDSGGGSTEGEELHKDDSLYALSGKKKGNEGEGKNVNSTSYTLQRNKKIKKMANLEIFRYFPTPVKYRNYEAKILYSLQGCNHVIKLLGVCSLREGEESLILEYCAGGSLEKYIYMDEKKKNGAYKRHLSRPKIVKIFQQVAEGMHNVHSKHFFHRDLKLSNILLDANQDAVISDFGLSTHFSLNDSPTAYAMYGNVFYAAPEVLKGEGFFKESDVWSFGVSLWEALTRKIAYDGMSASESFCKISAGELVLPIPRDLPLELSELLRSMLEYDFTKRPLFDVIARRLERIRLDAHEKLHVDIQSFFYG
ncbi:TKL/MLK protein kinase [Plasmodium fragile]|uniref:TKL/MLK protein kinase n=1 Tax=Plasmodium fragile TaxID=5857 RepID=A0A0D9QGT6_PLAFR|nr:TKL/MLK protein kinase [Plasmodium fragile]KJP86270.1 TKL/MLK protein kinase [Plasmodium fragile]